MTNNNSIARRALVVAWILAVTQVMAPGAEAAGERAFAGAEGFGAQSIGGRGGRLIEVTNLNDSGPGSLRAALEASGPRIVVFRVGGTIALKKQIQITESYLTLPDRRRTNGARGRDPDPR